MVTRYPARHMAWHAALLAALLPMGAQAQSEAPGLLADAVAGPDYRGDSPEQTVYGPSGPTADQQVENAGGKLSIDSAEGAASVRQQATGDDFYCQRRGLGTWFYCEHPKADSRPPASQASVSATDQIEALRKRGDELRNRAILNPTEANVIAYMKYQRQQTDMASTLADTWGRILIAHPELDYTQQRPVSNLGKANWQEQRQADIEATMHALNDRYGVFYFY